LKQALNALGTIFEQETGAKIFDAFKKEIADPIGMEDFSVENCEYFYQKDKSQHPSYSFRMSARDMARFGLLYLRKGKHLVSLIMNARISKE